MTFATKLHFSERKLYPVTINTDLPANLHFQHHWRSASHEFFDRSAIRPNSWKPTKRSGDHGSAGKALSGALCLLWPLRRRPTRSLPVPPMLVLLLVVLVVLVLVVVLLVLLLVVVLLLLLLVH